MEDNELPAELVIASEEQMLAEVYPNGLDLFTPIGAATAWWLAVLDLETYGTALELLTVSSTSWGGFTDAQAALTGRSMCSGVHPLPGVEDRVASIKFIPDSGHTMQVFGVVPLIDVKVLTLFRADDGIWRALILGDTFPTFDEVISAFES